MTIWVYGASFAHVVDDEDEQWVNIVAKELKQDVRSYSLSLVTPITLNLFE